MTGEKNGMTVLYNVTLSEVETSPSALNQVDSSAAW